MSRRWPAAVLALLATLALACEGAAGADGDPDRPGPALPSSMAALGDSITAGFGSCLTLVACHRNSWATGTTRDVSSHYRRILAGQPAIRGRARNLAEPGARAAALERQARAAVRGGAAYVTVLVGANDACVGGVDAMTPVATFRQQIDRGLRTLRRGLPEARVLVVAVPDLYRLWQIGHTDRRAVRAWLFGVCPALLAAPTSTAGADRRRREAVRDRVDDYNRELRAACRASGDRCRYVAASHRVRFTLDMVSPLDYFHPDVDGQARLAEVTWPGRFRW